jgi:hypothetical protein
MIEEREVEHAVLLDDHSGIDVAVPVPLDPVLRIDDKANAAPPAGVVVGAVVDVIDVDVLVHREPLGPSVHHVPIAGLPPEGFHSTLGST